MEKHKLQLEKHRLDLTQKFIILDDDLTKKYYSFIKNLLLSSTGFITVLISFTKVNKCNLINIYMRNIAISSIGLGILFASILLYGEVNVLKRAQNKLREYINELNIGKEPSFDVLEIDRKPIYKFVEIICFMFYIIFILSLIFFGLTL